MQRLSGLVIGIAALTAVALAAQGTPPMVWCHISHVYRDGASLYFTFVSRSRPGEEIAQCHAAKTAACETRPDGLCRVPPCD